MDQETTKAQIVEKLVSLLWSLLCLKFYFYFPWTKLHWSFKVQFKYKFSSVFNHYLFCVSIVLYLYKWKNTWYTVSGYSYITIGPGISLWAMREGFILLFSIDLINIFWMIIKVLDCDIWFLTDVNIINFIIMFYFMR